jgi:hypothetical protein
MVLRFTSNDVRYDSARVAREIEQAVTTASRA